MEPLQYEPRTKQLIKESLYDFLYAPVLKAFKLRLDTIIIRNTILTGSPHRSFHYKGEFYSCDTMPAPRKWIKLVASLKDEMDEYLADCKDLNEKELPFVLGYINQVLNSSNDLNDYLRLLPESAHSPVQQLLATCPCRSNQLSDEKVAQMRARHQTTIDMMKARMVTNLLI